MGKRELIALLNVSSWCLVMVERLFLAVPRGCLQFVIVVYPDHTHYFLSLVACKNEEDPIKIEGARVVTTLFINFSDTQGQLTPKSVMES